MKGFIILICSIGIVLAAPQYNYSPGHSGTSHHGSYSSGGSSTLSGGSVFGNFGGSLGGGGGSRFTSSGADFGVTGGGGQEIITKHFFIHSAPEEQDEVGADKVINLGPGRKHYRVVFIKAPHQGAQAGKVRLIAPANEEKTVIYVLSKKTDLSEIQADVQQAQSEPTKPEVHFIKYKTNEEAAHAQRTIQADYEKLGGTSQVSDEGVAPIQSVIGVLGDSSTGGGHSGGNLIGSGSFTSSGGSYSQGSINSITGSSSITGGGAPATSYLPPSH
ncbi:uncharacterized protein LOC129612474 [Condylostylus longicornis]|uniref:uncharacterized protein LOC129612474 n=1 Tax=Condylostylus longicornis TaxID=2530218 RepID=UPI00244DFD4A|nr:uncharacterized protein LOC129612474 [Condylostylus longicornis]